MEARLVRVDQLVVGGVKLVAGGGGVAVVEGDGTIKLMVRKSKIKKVGGGHIHIQFDPRNFKDIYRDEHTNEILPPEQV